MNVTEYYLMRKDVEICQFDIEVGQHGGTIAVTVNSIFFPDAMPIAIANGQSMKHFLEGRFIPRNRENIRAILSTLNPNGVIDLQLLLLSTRALSLKDDFWVKETTDNIGWAECNLFDNRFNTRIAHIAFTGYGSGYASGFRSSPEYTTDGMLRKAWRREADRIYLYKAGTRGYANAGNEPYSEYFASQVASHLELSHVSYELRSWKKNICSVCELFTSKEISFIPAKHYFDMGIRFEETVANMEKNSQLYQSISDMIMFDAIIDNSDRHLGNFGVLQNNNTLQVSSELGPIFDNGLSLGWNLLEVDAASSIEHMQYSMFARTVALDFIKVFLGDRQRALLRRMIGFKFKRHHRHNPPAWRIKLMQNMVDARVRQLLQ